MCIRDKHWDGNDLMGTVEILPTPSGNILKELLKGMIPSSPELHVQRNIPINGTNRTFLYEKTFPEGHFYEAEYTDLEMHWIMAIFGILVFVEGWLKNISTQLL